MELLNRRSEKSRRGISAVEAALLFPLVLLFLFGAIEYGWMLLKNQEIKNASRHGARIGVREIATSGDVTAGITQLMTDAGLDGSGYTVTLSPADVSSMAVGSVLTVTITVPYNAIELTGAPFLPLPANLIEATSMVKEGAP